MRDTNVLLWISFHNQFILSIVENFVETSTKSHFSTISTVYTIDTAYRISMAIEMIR